MERPPLLPRTALTLAATAALIAPAAVAYGTERAPQAPAASWSLTWHPEAGAAGMAPLQTTSLLTRNFKAYKLQ
ncbi:hypothetical protein [Streptomyces sp. NBRC 110028]|uniref:hypothetical protein n=1 Tax=Streptomyces sp. NBRC 110028 TaxID=1621260 RepID=UPI0006E1FCB7|nr:hypothetical protein [Streptomyces sp. NBRC 110028]